MDRVMLSKSSIQFSVDGWDSIPPCYVTRGQIMVEVMKITSKKRGQKHTKELYKKDLHDLDNHKDLLYITWNYTQYFIMRDNEKESRK